ncbi:MAG: phospholipase D-like domain-containing protein [Lachnospiraceae bacterium]|nr:phospholipase D-like domain-containing protein [Lachnospiraceae bacterium]MCH4029429.1 phospholipase D-like domain-containing protein [Lachnospiraceae bacterium]MCH4113743.1 phospholipase D-like domain-containing protein [Lachnospiraceae bacterium]MCI1353605.1 phospholipase D-like domain-containing protein [Lachnospiraceae bacterium]MCI1367636.1 phospholipase D-like domain-containing protein [Lachnospiraceae bacterium]
MEKKKIRTEQRYYAGKSTGRIFFVAVFMAIQVWILTSAITGLLGYYTYFDAAMKAAAVVMALRISGRHTNAANKIPWIIVILVFPIFGIVLYLLTTGSLTLVPKRRHFHAYESELPALLPQDRNAYHDLRCTEDRVFTQARYLFNNAYYPVYQNTKAVYFPEAEEGRRAQIRALRSAKKFIFMEYFSVEDKECFAEIKEILYAKAEEGVDVRLMYDDVGSAKFLSFRFVKEMESHGIKCQDFNPISAFFDIFMNNRDHRKITVIDGKIAFTGGYNLANEYFGMEHPEPYGHWKDTGVMLEGDAAHSFTIMFLEMWNAIRREDWSEDLADYMHDPYLDRLYGGKYEIAQADQSAAVPDKSLNGRREERREEKKHIGDIVLKTEASSQKNVLNQDMQEDDAKMPVRDFEGDRNQLLRNLPEGESFVQPFGESPLDEEYTSESVIMNMLGSAQKYFWISTPYLILDDEMTRCLSLAAKRGVDVRVLTPGIPDKKFIYMVTRSYYGQLVKGGVRIFEYTPGFNHGKMCVSDDIVAQVGSVNLDYRSLYLHFEDAVVFYGGSIIGDIKKDFDSLWPVSKEVTEQYKKRRTPMRITQCIVRLFAPLF